MTNEETKRRKKTYKIQPSDTAAEEIEKTLENLLGLEPHPCVVLCIGTDGIIGDCLGPMVGSMLKEPLAPYGVKVYGTLEEPATARNLEKVVREIHEETPDCKILAIDAGVGSETEVGTIKITSVGIRPRSGVGKGMNQVGSCSILGILTEKRKGDEVMFAIKYIRLREVVRLVKPMAQGVRTYFESRCTL